MGRRTLGDPGDHRTQRGLHDFSRALRPAAGSAAHRSVRRPRLLGRGEAAPHRVLGDDAGIEQPKADPITTQDVPRARNLAPSLEHPLPTILSKVGFQGNQVPSGSLHWLSGPTDERQEAMKNRRSEAGSAGSYCEAPFFVRRFCRLFMTRVTRLMRAVNCSFLGSRACARFQTRKASSYCCRL